MGFFRGSSRHHWSVIFFRFMAWLLIWAFFLPAPLVGQAASARSSGDAQPWNRHVHERLNSPERARAIEEAARIGATAREEFERGQAAAAQTVTSPALPAADAGKALAQTGPQGKDPYRPQSVGEVLFNYGAGFMGVPGLAPQRGVDGSPDEGLGFHQDGTARKAGGVAGSSGPSDRGQRAGAYMRSGFRGGYGLGYGPGSGLFGSGDGGLYDPMYQDIFGLNDPTRGGLKTNSSREVNAFDNFDPMNMAIDRGLSYGAGFVNSMGEAAISGLVDGGRARLNFRMDRDGYFSGEGDALLPFYDNARTTIYTQLGARSMHDSSDTRWIGNLGLGQRWFPLATGDDYKSASYDAGNLMLGYNAFFDYDLSRDHQRGGLGAEVWYDWLRLSSNYYFPISDWKGSEDFDSRFVKERPAEGWDARVKAYLPFYRNVAITGSYSQWFGDRVGMFGADRLEKDPKVWSYGIEYTPFPLLSGFITQKSTEQGRSDTEFGLNVTYHFQMPWEDQVSHAKVAELRTVGGSRHEFVDRENKIILEYKAKNAFMIEYLGPNGSNVNEFVFRIRNGFDEYKAGQTVRVTASGVTLAEAPEPEKSLFARIGGVIADFFSTPTAHAADFSQIYTTDSQGHFVVRVDSGFAGAVTLHVQAGSNTQSFTVNVVTNLAWELDPVSGSSTLTQGSSGSLTLTLTRGGVAQPGVTVTFTPNANVQGLPGSATTDASGQITLPGLVVMTPTDQTLTATVDGGTKLEIPVTVIPGAYTLEADPATLTQHTPAKVTFTLKVSGTPLPANTSVTFAANANFINLPTTAQMTDANGQIAVDNLTVTASDTQTIQAGVDGQPVSAEITVTAAGYGLEVSPASLTQHEKTSVTFTVKRNNAALANSPVTFAANANFTELASAVTQATDASGQIKLDLTAIASGSQTVSATVDGQTVSADIAVTAAGYALEVSPASLTQHEKTSVTFTVKRNNAALANAPVTFAANASFTELASAVTQTADASGQIKLDLTAIASGSQTVSATVDGQTVSADITVTAAGYGLEVSPASLTQYETTSVTFTVKRNNAALANAPVTFAANANFTELASAVTQTTDASGQIKLDLTAIASGSQTVSATVDGQTVSAAINVASVTYTLEASPTSLTQHLPANVTFTVKRNDAPLANTPVSFAANANFTQLASGVNQPTDAAGQIKLDLTVTASTDQTIHATVDGQTVSADITVTAASYSLEQTPGTTLTEGETVTSVPFVLKMNGQPVTDGTSVTLSYSTTDGAFDSPSGSASVGANGTFSVGLTGKTAGNVTVTATWDGGKSASCTVRVYASYSLSSFTVNESYADRTVTKTISVTLRGGPSVSGKQINWASTKGTLFATSSNTNGSGVATITLTHSIFESTSVTATMADDTNASNMETVYFGPENAPRFDLSTLTTNKTYEQAKTHCVTESRIPEMTDFQKLADDFGGNGWWSASGLPNGTYRTRDWSVVSSAHWLVFMPRGDGGAASGHDAVGYSVLCLAP